MATRREIKLYGDLLYQYKPTIRSLIASLLMEKLKNQTRYRKPVDVGGMKLEDVVKEKLQNPEPQEKINPNYFALVINDTVEEIIIVNDLIAELFDDERLKIVSFNPEDTFVKPGDRIVDGEFVSEESSDV